MSKGDWYFERSSGYPGYRCVKCATWVYENKTLRCDCDRPSVAAQIKIREAELRQSELLKEKYGK